MKTEAIKKCITTAYITKQTCGSHLNCVPTTEATEELQALEQRIAELETAVAVKDEALQQIRVVAANCDVDDGLETARCVSAVELLALKAQSSESADKVLVGVEKLREIEWGGIRAGFCPGCLNSIERGHSDDCWLDAKLKEVGDGS